LKCRLDACKEKCHQGEDMNLSLVEAHHCQQRQEQEIFAVSDTYSLQANALDDM